VNFIYKNLQTDEKDETLDKVKGFTEDFYREFVGGDLNMVKDFISAAAEGCHVEITKLIIPGKNDSESEMRRMAAWIASLRGGTGKDIPLHVSRYFPRYKWTAPATSVKTVYRLAETAREKLDYVYTGNC
jgi:pyruvate formate lyase activating enzyme